MFVSFRLRCFVYGRNGIWILVNKTTSRKSSFCISMTDLILRGNSKVVIKLKQMHKIKVVMSWCYAHYQTKFFEEVHRQNLTVCMCLCVIFLTDN